MASNNRYFPHDSNAKDDPKCVLLIDDMGMEGYGIYWMLIEVLREQPDYSYPIANAMALARRYNTSTESVKQVIYKYDLFVVEEDRIFFSESLNRRMAEAEMRSQVLAEAGRKGAEIRWNKWQGDSHPIATLKQGDSQAIATQWQYKSKSKTKEIERKPPKGVKERSAPMRFTPPSLEDVREFIANNGYTLVNAEAFYNHYEAIGWKVGKNTMKDWHAAVRGWQSREKAQAPKVAEQPQGKKYKMSM